MQNVIRSKIKLTEEEIAKLKEMDWDTYYREQASSEEKSLSNCPKCNSIVVLGKDQAEVTCYNCGEKIT